MITYFLYLLKILLIFIPILVSVAYFTLAERKILAATQRRRGPNVIGLFGLLQPISDGVKLLFKEFIIPSNADKFIFFISPVLTFFLSLAGWCVIPYSYTGLLVDLPLSLLYILAVSALEVYGVIMSGWSSNSKYAFLGSMRSTAQMISYELPIGIIICIIALSTGSFNLSDIITAQSNFFYCFNFPLLVYIFFISSLAETNRHPFDLPEAEAELVSGYNVEYASMNFALFSLGEYAHILLMSSLQIILFFGGWLSPFIFLKNYIFINSKYNFLIGNDYVFWFGFKIIFFVVLYILIRAAIPRYRYDQLMYLTWKGFLPITLAHFICVFMFLFATNSIPF